ncbi:MAG: thermonuclease family protein [Clostridia bacterium]|nr:thermonuclease family protein [Clostridia bacterium]
MKKKQKKLISGIITGVLALVLVVLDQAGYIDLEKYLDNNAVVTENNAYINVDGLTECEVVRVVDGDTIVVDFNGKDEKVRLIGVDTPESVHADETKNTKEGILVSDYTKSKLTGKKVKLEFDVQERDKYGRLLAYVYIDGEMYNKHLLEIGYAKIATYPPNVKYVEDFKEIQKQARENKVGLWAE